MDGYARGSLRAVLGTVIASVRAGRAVRVSMGVIVSVWLAYVIFTRLFLLGVFGNNQTLRC